MVSAGETMPTAGNGDLGSYVHEVAERVSGVLGERLVGVWLVGSAALGDYDPRRSDIDVQAVATGHLSLSEREHLAERLEHEALPNPARGLEFVLYAMAELADATGPRFQLNLNTGSGLPRHVAYDPDDDPCFWFTIDVSIARQAAVPLTGPPASLVFPEPPRSLLVTALLEALDHHAGAPDAQDQTLLSACRTWAWAVDGIWRNKGDSARWAMERVPAAPIHQALRRRAGEPVDPPGRDAVDRLLTSARVALLSHAR